MDYIIGFVFGALIMTVCVLLWDKFHKRPPVVERIKDLELIRQDTNIYSVRVWQEF